MMRYARLWPPPWCRVVIRPWLLRPPFLGSGRVSDFSGVVRVISTKSATEEPRRPGVVGLYFLIAIRKPVLHCVERLRGGLRPHSGASSRDRPPEDVDAVPLSEAH